MSHGAINVVPLWLLVATVGVPLRVLKGNCTTLKLQSQAAELRVYPAMYFNRGCSGTALCKIYSQSEESGCVIYDARWESRFDLDRNVPPKK